MRGRLMAVGLMNLALLDAEAGLREEAARRFEEAEAIFKETGNEDDANHGREQALELRGSGSPPKPHEIGGSSVRSAPN